MAAWLLGSEILASGALLGRTRAYTRWQEGLSGLIVVAHSTTNAVHNSPLSHCTFIR